MIRPRLQVDDGRLARVDGALEVRHRHVAVAVVGLEPVAPEELCDRLGLRPARMRRLERRVERALVDRGVSVGRQ